MLQIKNIYKKYDSVLALNGLNMEIGKGQLYGFVGPNGAGKTTTIKIIAGLLPMTQGEIWLDGELINKNTNIFKKKIGYVPDYFGVYDNLTVLEYLEIYASTYGMYGKAGTKRAQEVLEQVGLYHMENRLIEDLSRGIKQRIGLARAILHKPQLLVLDELSQGMDPSARRMLKTLLRNLCQDGYTVLISSHMLDDLADVCSNIGIINQGKMILQGDMEDIMFSIDSSNPILIEILTNMEQAIACLKQNPLVKRMSIGRNRISILFAGSREEEAFLIRDLIEEGVLLTSFKREYNNLESVFFHLTESEM